ncbi:hypothetical protein ElyMa_005770700 [Elysia marginata]|uniref:Uncharacterized protein n=1 Tax=Elysia marginata TaxID=1093978 RepID=A0AAV4FQ47_9GAST|nr:hypothetical protein ElyMa_005770700 [Elysia marginata]
MREADGAEEMVARCPDTGRECRVASHVWTIRSRQGEITLMLTSHTENSKQGGGRFRGSKGKKDKKKRDEIGEVDRERKKEKERQTEKETKTETD